MLGTLALTDFGWYERLLPHPELDEVNFWKPTASRVIRPPEFSPFLFKLPQPHRAICGFGYFAGQQPLPDWWAWETFGIANGCETLEEMRSRIAAIRRRIRFQGEAGLEMIGCIVVVQPTFFAREDWVAQPADWPCRTQSDKRYDLTMGEGARVWQACLERGARLRRFAEASGIPFGADPAGPRFGPARLVRPRLGQRSFRVAVLDAYQRACAVTGEHSLPVLEAAHIRPYGDEGPHEVANGLLLRADLHRLFEHGYLTVSPDHRLEISRRLWDDFQNGRSYRELEGSRLLVPARKAHRPSAEHLEWHRQHLYLG